MDNPLEKGGVQATQDRARWYCRSPCAGRAARPQGARAPPPSAPAAAPPAPGPARAAHHTPRSVALDDMLSNREHHVGNLLRVGTEAEGMCQECALFLWAPQQQRRLLKVLRVTLQNLAKITTKKKCNFYSPGCSAYVHLHDLVLSKQRPDQPTAHPAPRRQMHTLKHGMTHR